MERIETKEELEAFAKLTPSEARLFRRGLLAYAGALLCFTNDLDAHEFVPCVPPLSTFAEQTDAGRFLGIVYNGRAALVPMKCEVVRALCVPDTKEKPF